MKSKKVKKILLIALTCVAISASVSAEAAMKSQITVESKNKYEQLKISESRVYGEYPTGDYKKITLQAVYDRLNDDTNQNRWFADFMSLDFVQNMKDYERQAIWKQWHTLSPLQKELFIKGELNNLRDKYLDIGEGEMDKASENSYARIDRTINEYRQLDSFK